MRARGTPHPWMVNRRVGRRVCWAACGARAHSHKARALQGLKGQPGRPRAPGWAHISGRRSAASARRPQGRPRK
jgi:hypothetical protein